MRILQLEEEAVKKQCDEIIVLKPDLVITEKGVSDLAQHFLVKNNISCLRRLKKSDCNRVARAVGANIASDTSDLKEEDVGTGCGLFEIRKIGDEYFSFLVQCKNPKACTIMLRGPSKDILNEVDRNIQDALQVSYIYLCCMFINFYVVNALTCLYKFLFLHFLIFTFSLSLLVQLFSIIYSLVLFYYIKI